MHGWIVQHCTKNVADNIVRLMVGVQLFKPLWTVDEMWLNCNYNQDFGNWYLGHNVPDPTTLEW